MNKLNKIFSIFAFISVFFVFTSVSYASEIFQEGNTTLNEVSYCGGTRVDSSFPNIGINESQFDSIVDNYVKSGFSSSEEFDSLISDTINYYNNLYGTSFDGYFLYKSSSTSGYYRIFIYNRSQVDFVGLLESNFFAYSYLPGSSYIDFSVITSRNDYIYYISGTTEGCCYTHKLTWPLSFNTNTSVKSLTSYSKSSSEYVFIWDGETYLYKADEPPSDEPTFPTNKEIADAVQKFYNSDIYKNNTNFKDFYVIYSSLRNTYAFIGTDVNLNQHIYYDGATDYYGFSSSDTWWKFNITGMLEGYIYNRDFYLYFMDSNSDVITSEGVGSVSELEKQKYSMYMTIVYCTHDYTVIEHRPPAEGETENQITTGTVDGDSYTYDENLDPTDNQYSPLQNFVGSNPTQSILNDVDFDSINQAFEDSKGILNIQGASWIFTANNQLVEYFIGFITFLIILLVISRIMGG